MLRLFKGLILLVSLSFSISAFAWVEVTATKGETIESLAEKYRPQGVAAMDMVIAIRHANPQVISKGLKPGMALHIPTTTPQVRQAITGQRQSGAKDRSVAAEPSAQSEEKLEATPVAKPVKQTQVQEKKAKTKAKEKARAKSEPKKTATKPAAKSEPKSERKSKPTPKPVAKPVKTYVPVVAKPVQVSNNQDTINNLQQTVNNQAQTIQNYQNQVADLTGQLKAAKQSSSANSGGIGLFSFANIWFALWVITFFLFWMSRQKNRKLMTQKNESKVSSVDPTIDERQAAEPRIMPTQTDTEDSNERLEPSLHNVDEQEWRQVELDIPATGAPAQTNIRLEPSFSFEEQQELVGEQQDIINAIANDHDNLEWHLALLEFYVKTNNEAGFLRHMQTMNRTGLMNDGDTLWEKVRKMYLSAWVYKEEGL